MIRASRRRTRGFVAALVFVAVALGVALAVAFNTVNSNTSQNTNQLTIATQVPAQANLIRQMIANCTLRYPQGGGSPLTLYPAVPGTTLAKDLLCPGAPLAQQAIWNGPDLVALPKPPKGFGAWTYSKSGGLGSETISITIAPGAALLNNPQVVAGLEQALRQFSTEEAHCTAGGAAFTVYIRTPTPTTYSTRCQ